MMEEAGKPGKTYHNTYFILPAMPGWAGRLECGRSVCLPASSSSLVNSWNRQGRFQLQREEKPGGPSFWWGEIQGGV